MLFSSSALCSSCAHRLPESEDRTEPLSSGDEQADLPQSPWRNTAHGPHAASEALRPGTTSLKTW